MLSHPTLDQLLALRLDGMAKAFEEQLQMRNVKDLPFEDRLGFLIDREMTVRKDRRLKTRLRQAKLRPIPSLHLETITKFDPQKCHYRNGKWVEP